MEAADRTAWPNSIPPAPEYAQVADRYHRIEHEFRTRDGYAIEAQVGTVLCRPGLSARKTGRGTPKNSPAAGRCASRWPSCCCEKPNLLLLDEPTNHLDLEARNWLEEYLAQLSLRLRADLARPLLPRRHRRPRSSRSGTSAFTSTPATTTSIWRRRPSAGRSSKPPTATSATASSNWKSSSTASATRPPRPSRCRAASRNWRRSSASRFRRKRRPSTSPSRSPSRAAGSWPSSRASRRATATKQCFRDVNFMIERGDRIALVGVNGAGKSTLIKLLARRRTADRGRVQPRPQRRARLLRAGPVQGTRSRCAHARRPGRAVARAPRKPSCAACWDAFCSPTTTSSSASACSPAASATATRWRACCCIPSNFLLLDEPTNHLDMRAKDVLLKALQDYTGTVVFVSHDRYFIDKLATRVFEVENGQVQVFPGNYEDYLWRKAGRRSGSRRRTRRHRPRRRPRRPAAADARRRQAMPKRGHPPKSDQTAADEGAQPRDRRRNHAPGSRDRGLRSSVGQLREMWKKPSGSHELLEARRADLEALMTEWEEVAQLIEANS